MYCVGNVEGMFRLDLAATAQALADGPHPEDAIAAPGQDDPVLASSWHDTYLCNHCKGMIRVERTAAALEAQYGPQLDSYELLSDDE